MRYTKADIPLRPGRNWHKRRIVRAIWVAEQRWYQTPAQRTRERMEDLQYLASKPRRRQVPRILLSTLLRHAANRRKSRLRRLSH